MTKEAPEDDEERSSAMMKWCGGGDAKRSLRPRAGVHYLTTAMPTFELATVTLSSGVLTKRMAATASVAASRADITFFMSGFPVKSFSRNPSAGGHCHGTPQDGPGHIAAPGRGGPSRLSRHREACAWLLRRLRHARTNQSGSVTSLPILKSSEVSKICFAFSTGIDS